MRDRAKSRTHLDRLEQEFVANLEDLQVPAANLGKLTQHFGLEHRLDVVEHDRKFVAVRQLLELGLECLGSVMPRPLRELGFGVRERDFHHERL